MQQLSLHNNCIMLHLFYVILLMLISPPQLEDWLYDEGFDAAAPTYTEKVSALDKIFRPIETRVREHNMRPQAIQARLLMGMGVAVVVVGAGALLRNGGVGDRLKQVLLRALEGIMWAWGGCKVLGQRVLGWGRLYRWGNRGRGRRLGSQGRPVRR